MRFSGSEFEGRDYEILQKRRQGSDLKLYEGDKGFGDFVKRNRKFSPALKKIKQDSGSPEPRKGKCT